MRDDDKKKEAYTEHTEQFTEKIMNKKRSEL